MIEAAAQAHDEALKRIEQARETSAQKLDLSQLVSLTQLPEEISLLTSLKSLNLLYCPKLSDLTPLEKLTALQSLDLSRCEHVNDLTPLAKLTALQSLYLSGCEQVNDLTPLAKLTALQSLDLNGCEQVKDLTPLQELSSLRTLSIQGHIGSLRFAPLKLLVSHLQELDLRNSYFEDLPSEVSGASDNVIDSVRAHFEDLDKGETTDYETKLIVLGNGGAGKTQLCRRLQGEGFDETVPSTHGVQVRETILELEEVADPIHLNMWDFGGQEVYHGSHALFLQGRSVSAILWTPKLEDSKPYMEQGIPMRHRPLTYWVDYVRAFAGTRNPIILVQSQCDTADQKVRVPPAGQLDDFDGIQMVQVSAKTGLRLDQMRTALKEAIRESLLRRPAVPIGLGRVRVRRRLRELQYEQGYQTLERVEFDQMCEEAGSISSTEALLQFLHHAGALFYQANLFGGRIILDQNWALKAVYTIFDREKMLPVLRGLGRFSREELERLVWQDYTPEEQDLFLGMMESCGICFRVGHGLNGQREYIAPELLPPWDEAERTVLVGRIPSSTPMAEAEARYSFLHEGVLRNYLSRIGRHAGDAAIYWRFGCWFYEKTTDSRALIQCRWIDAEREMGEGSIRFSAWGANAEQLIRPLLEELEQLQFGQKPDIQWHTAKTARAVNRPGIEGSGVEPKLGVETLLIQRESEKVPFLEWARGNRMTLAIVFTDVVGSTALGERLKDEHMKEVRQAHFDQSRPLIERFRGEEIKTLGDSFMVAFLSVDAALDFAIALYENPGDPRVQVRAGIHVGEMDVDEKEQDVFGSNVNFAARVVSACKGAEIWISDEAMRAIRRSGTGRHSTLIWEEHKGVSLKGFEPDTFTLWSVCRTAAGAGWLARIKTIRN